jgi:hypothetical protein
MQENDWVIEPIPTQERDVQVSVRSPRLLSVLFNRICWSESWGVEALLIASSYFSRFPKVERDCTRHSADEARHTSLYAERTIALGGRLRPFPGSSDMLNHLPGFNTGAQGDTDTLVDFMSRGYVEEYRGLLFFDALADALAEVDPVTEKIVRRVAIDERNHVSSLRELLESLMKDKYVEVIPAKFAKYKLSNRITV